MIYIFIALKEFCVLWSAQELLDNRADEKKIISSYSRSNVYIVVSNSLCLRLKVYRSSTCTKYTVICVTLI